MPLDEWGDQPVDEWRKPMNEWGDTMESIAKASFQKSSRLLEENKKLREKLAEKINGETSDGYHTFNELYHHRAVLFAALCNNTSVQAWKSKLHHDGTMYDGMFIVGMSLPRGFGQVSYHYDIDPYWDMFDVLELDRAPEWDGHTPTDAINRIERFFVR